MACPDFNNFKKFILAIDQNVPIDKKADKDLRYDVWKTTSDEISKLTSELSAKVLPESSQSLRILDKLKGTLQRIRDSAAKGGTIQKDIFDHEYNVEMSIALHELMESVKGEADKARNLGIDVTSVSDSGVLPALPLSRVAASIGRKIAFQKGYRFKRATNKGSAAEIEAMYYDIGKEALNQLNKQGYVKMHTGVSTIFDYLNKKDVESKKSFTKNDPTRSDVLSVSLNEETLGINPDTEESAYFLKRTEADLDDTNLGVITDKLRAANMILQPATVVLPDTEPSATDAELAQWDDGVKKPDPKTEKARKIIYENPTYVNKSMHDLMKLFNEELKNTGTSASKRISEIFGTRKNMLRSLFGMKRSDDFSIDKKESISGQNLSKTTPLDDQVEYYDLMQKDGEPSPLHMKMKQGRNVRLYYLNSVMNAHGSKHSRSMLTPGEYTVDSGSDDFNYLAFSISEALKVKKSGKVEAKQFTYEQLLNGKELDLALKLHDEYMNAASLKGKLYALGKLAKEFQGVDYVKIVTALQGVKDIRNSKNGRVSTEFPISADAVAQGGTLTFLQAVGTNSKVTELLQRIGVFNPDSLVQKDLDDLYGLMTEAVNNFVEDKPGAGLGADIGETDVKKIMKDTIDMLFLKQGESVREFSKDPTMTFIYTQGRNGSIETVSRSLADRIVNSLDDPNTRAYLADLFNDKKYNEMEGKKLKAEKDLYSAIVERLKKTELAGNIFDIMKENIQEEFLQEYSTRSEEVYDIVKKLPTDKPFKILPLGAVLAGKKASNLEDLETYGMPITKKVEVLNTFEGRPDTVLTRVEKPMKTVMDVSTTHGQDSGDLYHSIADVAPKDGIVVVHDQIIGSVQTVKAVVKQYKNTAKKAALEYDVHQQVMEAIAAQSPEIAASAEFIALKTKIDENVVEKQRIINELFNEDTDALIGDNAAVDKFVNPETEAKAATNEAKVDTKEETPVKSTKSKTGTPLAEQDFGNTFITLTDGNEEVRVEAQQIWDATQERLNMVEKLRICLAT